MNIHAAKIAKMSGLVLFVFLALGAYQLSLADDEDRYLPSEEQGWFCPWAGQYGMGPGMMWNRGGDWDRDEGWGPAQRRGIRNYNRTGEPLTMDQAKVLVENHLTSIGNPNLKSGKFTEKEISYEVEIVTREGSLVDKLIVDKQTGWMRSVY